MRRSEPKLTKIDHNSPISEGVFTEQLQRTLLLALQERGTLTVMQYRQAEEVLNQRHGKHLTKRKYP